ncbi:hypothetical protein LM602_04010, partial [Candidatus Acetothermia bacterium]|nr:hypothetical protein [Candidatus Acetothermia bacterium]MCI2435681.1 hypothetical protein [Candidatus Acetothermia bacterium]
MRKLIVVAAVIVSLLLSLLLGAVVTLAASESEPTVFRPSPNSTPSLNPSVSYYVYDERYNLFVSEIDGAVRNVLKSGWMLPSPLAIELGNPTLECPQEAVAFFCPEWGRGYSYINFRPATFSGNITKRYDVYYHELGHAVAEAYELFAEKGSSTCIEWDYNSYGRRQPWGCQWDEGFAEFFAAVFMDRNQSVFRVDDEQSPAFVANIMLEKVSSDGWDFFLCVYDEARRAIAVGYWTRYEWEKAVQNCAKPQIEVTISAPSAVGEGDTFEVFVSIRVLSPINAVLVSHEIPAGLQIVYGETRYGWLTAQAGEMLKASLTLKALFPGTFVLQTTITLTTASGAQKPFTIETTVTSLPRSEPPPPPPP